MKNRTKFALFAPLLLVLLTLCSAAPLFADSGDPSVRVGRLGYIQGTVSVQPSGVDQWSQAETNYPVATGDRLYTDQDGRDEIAIGGTVVRMWHGTDLTMTNLADELTQLGLAQGTIRVRTFGLDPSQQVEIDTPNGAVTVTQPGDIRIDSYDGDGGTQVTVNTGAVQVTGPNLSQNIRQGEAVRLVGTNPIELQQAQVPGADEFDQFSIARDHHIENARSAQYVSRYTPGYDDLDDYGSWDTGTEYGPVWYPRGVAVDWAPYRVGHWVWTGPWGWTWVESEPWGYAPFHYGRWAYVGSRWGWVPGPIAVRPVWSPALVAFAGGGGFSVGVRFGGGVGLAAWFPLGVGEPFIPWYHCSPGYVRQVNVTNINITRIRNTTIVNNYNTFVRNTNNYTNINNVHNVNYNYANRARAFTAANSRAFASGQPINRNLARVSPEQIRSAQVIAHAGIQPTRQSVVPNPVARQLPVPAQRPTLLTQGGRQMQAVAGARPQPVPYRALPANAARGAEPVNRGIAQPTNRGNPVQTNRAGTLPGENNGRFGPGTGPGAGTVRPNTPGSSNSGAGNGAARPLITRNGTTIPGRAAPNTGAQGVNGNNGFSRPGQNSNRGGYTPQPLVTHNEPPAQQPSFSQQQRGLSRDPGRPLDPQQRESVQQGRRPGPSQDQEYFPHAPQAQRSNAGSSGSFNMPRQAPQTYSAPRPMPQSRAPEMRAPESRPQQNQGAQPRGGDSHGNGGGGDHHGH